MDQSILAQITIGHINTHTHGHFIQHIQFKAKFFTKITIEKDKIIIN
jgi:hypothetical protein